MNPRRPALTARTIDLALLLLPGLGVLAGGLLLRSTGLSTGDPAFFLQWADGLLDGAVPGRDFLLYYPPLVLVPVVAARLPSGPDPYAFGTALIVLNAVLAVLTALALRSIARTRGDGDDGRRALLLWSAALVPMGAIAAWRYDLFPCMLATVGIAAVARGRPGMGGAALAAGAMAKVFPAFITPIAALWVACRADLRGAIRLVAVGVAVTVGVLGLAVLAGGNDALYFLGFQTGRGVQVESLAGSVLLALDRIGLGGAAVAWSDVAQSWFVDSGPASLLQRVLDPLLPLAAGAVSLACLGRFLRRRAAGGPDVDDLVLACAAVLLTVLLANKVFSPQYLLWALPFVVLIRRRSAFLGVVAACLTIAIVPFGYEALLREDPLIVGLLLVRNLLLVAVLADILVQLVRRRPASVAPMTVATATAAVPPPPAEPGAMARAAAAAAAREARPVEAQVSAPAGGRTVPGAAMRRRGAPLVPSVLLLVLASIAAAIVVARVGWLDGPWLWQPDLPQGTYPLAALFHQALGRGELPLWGDAVGLGAPLYAEGQIGALYPLNWIAYQLPPLQALDLVRVSHLALAGVGAGLITLRIAGSRTGAIVTAVLVVANGGIVSKLEWHQAVITYAWFPWILLPLVWSRGRPGARAIAIAGALFGVQALAGFPPYWTLTGIVATLVLIYRSGIRRSIWAVPLFGIVGLCAGAVQLLPTIILVGLSTRSAGVGTENLFEFSATPFDFLFVAFANAFVPLRFPQWDIYEGWQPAVSFWALLEGYAYIGLPAIALAVIGARTRRARAFIVLAAAAVALPIIGATEPAFVSSIPFINGLRHPIRAYIFLDVAIAILAGIGLARAGRGRSSRGAVVVVCALVVGYGIVTAVALAPGIFNELVARLWAEPVDAAMIRSRAVAALTAPWPLAAEIALAGAVLVLLSRRRSARVTTMIAALTVVPLLAFMPYVNTLYPRDRFTQEGSELAAAVISAGPRQVVAISEPFYPSLVGVLDATGARPPHLHTFRFQLSLRLRASDELVARLMYPSFDGVLARAIGLDTLVVFRDQPCPDGRPVAYVARDAATICRIDDAAPAPYWIPAEAVGPGTPRGGLLAPAEPIVDPGTATRVAVPAVVSDWRSDLTTAVVEAPDDGYIFIDRAWYPWWVATVDGRVVETQRLWSGTLVPVMAGTRQVEMRLIPLDAIIGGAISAGSLLILGAVLARDVRRRRGASAAGAPMSDPCEGGAANRPPDGAAGT